MFYKYIRKYFFLLLARTSSNKLTSPLFIEVPAKRKEIDKSCICVSGVSLFASIFFNIFHFELFWRRGMLCIFHIVLNIDFNFILNNSVVTYLSLNTITMRYVWTIHVFFFCVHVILFAETFERLGGFFNDYIFFFIFIPILL